MPSLRTSQFTILSMLERLGPTTINTLARNMVMDRTTLGRNIVPLQRSRLITVRRSPTDGRSRELQLTQAGLAHLEASVEGWRKAQAQFEAALGPERLAQLRSLLQVVVESDFRIDGDSRN
jgi:DNA-binding MarR family transcriptional regulator